MRILCWGTYDTGKPRTRILRNGLRLAGVEVTAVHASIWEGIEDKSQVSSRLHRALLLARWITAYPALVWRFFRQPRPDFVLIGFPGVLDVFVLAPFAWLRGVPIVWDMFMSLYDTVVMDRQLLRPASLLARMLYRIEKLAIRCVHLALLDTETHARHVEVLFALPANHCAAVWVGVETEHFASAESTYTLVPPRPGTVLRVLFYGQFIPLHGIETIIEAARLTVDDAIEWTLIGRGQQAPEIRRLLEQAPLAKLRWLDWVDYHNLRDSIATADLCLGIFGASGKAASVIPNKVFQVLTAGRPLVTRDSAAIRELLQPAPPCVYLVPAADAEALAAAVREHAQRAAAGELRATQGHCHRSIVSRITAPAIGAQFVSVVTQRLKLTRSGHAD